MNVPLCIRRVRNALPAQQKKHESDSEKLEESVRNRFSNFLTKDLFFSKFFRQKMDDDRIAFADDGDVQKGRLKHPYVTAFHLVFRVTAIVVYMFCGWFSDSFIASFVTVILLLSLDFWTVKNITGRIMVGLRWWNYVDDEGKSHWLYENKKNVAPNQMDPAESRIFWLALIIPSSLWAVFFIIALFGLKFKWLLLVSIAIIFNWANLYGYVKCKMGGDKNISAATTNFFRKQVVQNMASMMTKSPTTPTSQPANVI